MKNSQPRQMDSVHNMARAHHAARSDRFIYIVYMDRSRLVSFRIYIYSFRLVAPTSTYFQTYNRTFSCSVCVCVCSSLVSKYVYIHAHISIYIEIPNPRVRLLFHLDCALRRFCNLRQLISNEGSFTYIYTVSQSVYACYGGLGFLICFFIDAFGIGVMGVFQRGMPGFVGPMERWARTLRHLENMIGSGKQDFIKLNVHILCIHHLKHFKMRIFFVTQ